jgi:excisionase family DNA binding protein
MTFFDFSRTTGHFADRFLCVGSTNLESDKRESHQPRAPTDQSSGDCLVFTVTEAAVLLGVSRAFAYELAARGELPVLKLGRRIVVPKAALLALLNLVAEP